MDYIFRNTKKIKTTQSLQTVPTTRFSIGSINPIRSATLSELPSEEVEGLASISKCPSNPDHLFVSPESNLKSNESDPHVLGAELAKSILSKQYDTLLGLLQRGANPNFPLQSPDEALNSEISADSPLYVAAMLDDVRAAADLIDYGASITGNVAAKDIDYSPLGIAIKQKNYAVLELFLKTINGLYEIDFQPNEEQEDGGSSSEHEEYTEELSEQKPRVQETPSPPTSRTSSSSSLPSASPTSNGPVRKNSSSNLHSAGNSTSQSNRPPKRQRED